MLRRALEASPKTLRFGAGGSEVGSEGGIECAMMALMCSVMMEGKFVAA